jgi:hypothetical protein
VGTAALLSFEIILNVRLRCRVHLYGYKTRANSFPATFRMEIRDVWKKRAVAKLPVHLASAKWMSRYA